jgi:hypothetical protein
MRRPTVPARTATDLEDRLSALQAEALYRLTPKPRRQQDQRPSEAIPARQAVIPRGDTSQRLTNKSRPRHEHIIPNRTLEARPWGYTVVTYEVAA